ncbi:MAG TPA: BrnT family toxin [Pyrinomonadaceae bacterium]|nr:BrnT family toxin [Pyrinomonadaceae bacterium]
MRFEWDDAKAQSNLANHGVSSGEATEVFYDPNGLEDYDANIRRRKAGSSFIIGSTIGGTSYPNKLPTLIDE